MGGSGQAAMEYDTFFKDFPSEYKIDNMMTEGCVLCFNSLLKLAGLYSHLTSPACLTQPIAPTH